MFEVKERLQANLTKAIEASLANGSRLLTESYDLEFREPPATRYYLFMIAQEEFAKAFILYLVREGVAPFSAPVRRAMNDHSSKQLIGMIMDYMIMYWETLDELKAEIRADVELGDLLPNDVGSALEILCYEKIGRWAGRNWIWADDPNYDAGAKDVAAGKKDQKKQDALYIRIGRDGRPCSSPAAITKTDAAQELERAVRYRNFVSSATSGGDQSDRFLKVMQALQTLFHAQHQSSPQ